MSSQETDIPSWIFETMEQALEAARTSNEMVRSAHAILFDFVPGVPPSEDEEKVHFLFRPLGKFEAAINVVLLRVRGTGKVSYGILDWRKGYCGMTTIEQLAQMCGSDLMTIALEAQLIFV